MLDDEKLLRDRLHLFKVRHRRFDEIFREPIQLLKDFEFDVEDGGGKGSQFLLDQCPNFLNVSFGGRLKLIL